ncbi:MAG: outer membrane protein transport protein [Melioribacteraceae bacterium]
MKIFFNTIKSFLLILLMTSVIQAGGVNRTSLFGAKSSALNGLYFAGIDGVSNIYYNPAGLASLMGQSVEVTAFLRGEQNNFEGNIKGLYNSLREDDLNGGIGAYYNISEGLTAAIGVEAFYDYRTSWPYIVLSKRDATLITIGTDMYNQSFVEMISPAIAYKSGDFSVGLAVNVFHNTVKTSFALGNNKWKDNVGLPVYQADINGDAWSFNFNLGFMYQVNEDLRLGLTVLSGTSQDLTGEAKTNLFAVTDSAATFTNVNSTYQTPWKIGFGGVYNISSDLILNVDLKYNLYASLDKEIKYEFENSVWQANAMNSDSLTGFTLGSQPLEYKNSFEAGVGLEYIAAPDLNIYFGYKYVGTPNDDKTFSLLNPQVAYNQISAGLTYFDEEMAISLGVAYYKGLETEVKNTAYLVHEGLYNLDGLIPTLTFRFNL